MFPTALDSTCGRNLSAIFSGRLDLVFNRCTSGFNHYVTVFSSFLTTPWSGFSNRLPPVSLIIDESLHDADEHIDFLTSELGFYKTTWARVTRFIVDNCSVNRTIAHKVGILCIGCVIHRLNLLIRDFLTNDELVFSKVNRLIFKLRTLLLSAKMRLLTPFDGK